MLRTSVWTAVLSGVCLMAASATAETAVDFEDVSLAPESYYNGSDGAGGFESGLGNFPNSYDSSFGSWTGWACSSMTDTTTVGWSGQYNSIAGGAADGTNYGIVYAGFGATGMTFDAEIPVEGLLVTNTTYAYYSMQSGDAFAKAFGGESGDDPDWFLLTITGRDKFGTVTGSVDFYLADYRFEDNSEDYMVEEWTWVDLSPLGYVESLEFGLSSSDTGDFGMNTPAYVAVDGIVPEPTSVLLLGFGAAALLRRRRK